MKQFLKLTGCLAVAGLFASCQSAQQEADYQIIPLPQEIVTAQGSPFILKSGVKISCRLLENSYRKRLCHRSRNRR